MMNFSSFIETHSTRFITFLNWPRGIHSITYRSKNCIINIQEIKRHIASNFKDADFQKIIKAITVRKLDLNMVLKHDK